MNDASSRLSQFLAKKRQAELDEHVSRKIQALAKRGNVTRAEIAELRCNSWEWELLVPAMTDEALAQRVRHALDNSAHHKRPCTTYDQAIVELYAPELLRRFQRLCFEKDAAEDGPT